MPDIHFEPLGIRAEAAPDETILDVARRAGAPIGNSCGGVGWCKRCRVRIMNGENALSAMTSVEREQAQSNDFAPNERLACQAVVRGSVVVTTTYWGPMK